MLRRGAGWRHRPYGNRCSGWPPGPVAEDVDALSSHLFSTDAADDDVGVVSFMPHPCPLRPTARATYFWGWQSAPTLNTTATGSASFWR